MGHCQIAGLDQPLEDILGQRRWQMPQAVYHELSAHVGFHQVAIDEVQVRDVFFPDLVDNLR